MNSKMRSFFDIKRSSILSWLKELLARIPYKKKIRPFIKGIPRNLINLFAKNIHGTWLLRKWSSRAGYIILFLGSLVAIFIADQFEFTRQFIHANNANEVVIGVFTILLALLIPLAIALIQGDGNNPFARQTMVKTIIRFGWASFVLVLICLFLFIPSGIHIDSVGESLTLKNLYAAVLACCAMFMLASFYRSIRWLSDESSYGFDPSPNSDKPKSDVYGFSSYRFAWIIRLLERAKFQTWMAIWSQRFPIGYEDTIHEAFFKRVDSVIRNKKRKQYRSISFELQSYNDNFENRNQLSPKFEYQNPEKFFMLFGQVEKILAENYVDSRLDGLWNGKDALRNISVKIIEALSDNRRIWSLFQAMNKYVEKQDLLEIKGDELKHDELVETFLPAVFDAIKTDKMSAHDALSEVKDESAWAVTYDHLYDKKSRSNLSFLVENIYSKWLRDLLDKRNDKEYYLFNDSIVEHIFPGADPIILGKLYWLLHLAHSSDYLNLWIKEFRPIGLVNFTGEFEYVGEKTEEDMWKEYRERTNAQEINSIKIFCNLYFRYLRTNFMNLSENLKKAQNMDRTKLNEAEIDRLDDFIRIAELIEQFYKVSDEEREKTNKKSKPKTK